MQIYNIGDLQIIDESLLSEAKRSDLINKSKAGDNYKDMSKGKNRYERRLKSRVATSVSQYNKIDMDAFWKRDILTVGIDVHGETDDYVVTIRFQGVIKEIARDIQSSTNNKQGKFEFKNIAKALSRKFNSEDVFIGCTCPDFKYRMRYYSFKNGYGVQYEPRPSNITNPNDTKGAGCKHTLLVLGNLDWMMKVASVIYNYVKWSMKYMQNNYATYIFPKLYGVPYKQAVQLNIFDNGILPTDQKTISGVIQTGRQGKDAKGRWVAGNSYRFKKSETQDTPQEDDDQPTLFRFEKDKSGKERVVFDKDDTRDNRGRFIKGNEYRFKPKRRNSNQDDEVPQDEN